MSSSPVGLVGRLRVANQRIIGSAFQTPLEAVRFMLAMQGQDFPGVKWSVGLRVPGSRVADVEEAFTKGRIVRSWPMRGTLHVTVAEDLQWMLDLHSKRIVDGAVSRRIALELDGRTLERARASYARGRIILKELQEKGYATVTSNKKDNK